MDKASGSKNTDFKSSKRRHDSESVMEVRLTFLFLFFIIHMDNLIYLFIVFC